MKIVILGENSKMARLQPFFQGKPYRNDDQESGELDTIDSSAIQSSPSKPQMSRYSFLPRITDMALNEQVTAIVAVFTIVLSIASMTIEGSIFAIISGIFSIIMVLYHIRDIDNLDTLLIEL